MADKLCSLGLESCVTEHVIRVHVGVYDIADRLVGNLGDRGVQGLAEPLGAAGIDDGDRRTADNAASI